MFLNQVYRKKQTLNINFEVARNYDMFNKFSLKSNFLKFVDGVPMIRGRRYDASIILSQIDFNDKIVCELGARDSILGSYLTGFCSKVYMSDYFEMWEKGTIYDLGQPDYWFNMWKNVAIRPDNLICDVRDIMKLDYDSGMFDVVIALSVVDFLIGQHVDNDGNYDGDIVGLGEMVRICKPGGIIALSLCISNESADISGIHVYREKDLFERLIDKSGCKILGDYDFDLRNEYNDSLSNIKELYPVSNIIFFLQKDF
jgi:hypothetical protein